jgi:hypothetical protein
MYCNLQLICVSRKTYTSQALINRLDRDLIGSRAHIGYSEEGGNASLASGVEAVDQSTTVTSVVERIDRLVPGICPTRYSCYARIRWDRDQSTGSSAHLIETSAVMCVRHRGDNFDNITDWQYMKYL